MKSSTLQRRELWIEDELENFGPRWKVRKAGVALAAFLCFVGFVRGWTASGPPRLTEVKDSSAQIQASFDPIMRTQAAQWLTIGLKDTLVSEGVTELWISESYLKSFRILTIHPEPIQIRLEKGKIRYSFLATPERGKVRPRFLLEPMERGRVFAKLGSGEVQLEFNQWILP